MDHGQEARKLGETSKLFRAMNKVAGGGPNFRVKKRVNEIAEAFSKATANMSKALPHLRGKFNKSGGIF